jgi:lipid-A-disaccharide synthase
MLKAKNIIEAKLPDYSFRIIRPAHISQDFYRQFDSKTEIVAHSYNTLCESKFIIAASGTATVEIAILEIPYLIIYKINPLTFGILQKMVDTKFIGMVNILSSKKIIQELLQDQANPKNIAEKTLECIENTDKYQQIKSDLAGVKEKLAPYGATRKTADFIGDYLGLLTA